MKVRDMNDGEIAEVLASSTIARLGCAKDGRPYVVPVWFAYDDERRALIIHSIEGLKIAIMRENPQVCVQIDSIEHPWSWRSVVVHGTFAELKGPAAQRALDALVLRLLPPGADARKNPFAAPGAEDRSVMFRVDITEVSGKLATPR